MPRGRSATTTARSSTTTTATHAISGHDIIWQGQCGPYGYQLVRDPNHAMGIDVLAFEANVFGTYGTQKSVLGDANHLAQCFSLFLLDKGMLGAKPQGLISSSPLAN